MDPSSRKDGPRIILAAVCLVVGLIGGYMLGSMSGDDNAGRYQPTGNGKLVVDTHTGQVLIHHSELGLVTQEEYMGR